MHWQTGFIKCDFLDVHLSQVFSLARGLLLEYVSVSILPHCGLVGINDINVTENPGQLFLVGFG